MAFPLSPTNGQVASVGGVTYTYDSDTSSWTRQRASSVFTIVMDTFAGDGSTTSFYLSVTPAGKEFVTVNIDGVSQLKSAFDLSGNTLTFTGTPAAGAVIEIKSIANTGLTVLSGLVFDSFTGDGMQTVFTLNAAPTTKNYTIVTVGGIVQAKTNYSTTSNQLTFTTPPPAGAPIEITTLGPAAINTTTAATVSKAIAMSMVFGS